MTRTGQHQGAAARRGAVDGFVRRHFTWPGTLRLHRAALGLDILRAPANVLLSPVLLLARLAAWGCRRLRLTRAADWLARRRLLLRTAVAAKLEAAILTELLDIPLPGGALAGDGAALARAIGAAPRSGGTAGCGGGNARLHEAGDRIARVLAEYSGTRSAMAEVTTALVTLTVGALAFGALTPGMISMAPGVAEALSHGAAVAGFPLGAKLGAVWYGVFPVGPAPGLVAASVAALALLGAVAAAFAGTIADPVQAWTGIHRRRLLRLLDALEATLAGLPEKPFTAREHVLVRVFDLWDAALSLLRALRG